MKEPVDHIQRPSLPWRNGPGMTECGYDATKVKTLSRDEYRARLKEFGQQRSAMLTCMTCANTTSRWGTWDDDPRKAIEREISWETGWSKDDRGVRLRDELISIAALIEAHRDEFDASLTHTEQRRAWLDKKASAFGKPAPMRPRGVL